MSSSSASATSTVSLYRYDLTQGMARSMGPMLIGRPIEGIWHTSIVVFGKEYYFDGGVGIMADPNPGRTRFGPPYRTEVLGQTSKRQEEFFAWTQQQRRSGFGPNDYHLFNNNCNSFSDAASMYLLGRHIPQDIIDMIPSLLSTPMGQMLRPMLEQATSNGAGIGGVSGPSAAPLTQPPAPTPSSSSSLSSPATAARGDVCRGLLSPHTVITEADEEDLMLAQVMLESNETIADGPRSPPEAFERAISGLTLLQTVMSNICEHPTEAKYRALSMESNAYKTKLKPLEPYGVTEVLRIAGFVRRPHSSGSGGEQWYLSDAAGSAAVLERVGEMLAVTVSSIEGAAADAAKERAKIGTTGSSGGATTSTMQDVKGEGSGEALATPAAPLSNADHPAAAAAAAAGAAGDASSVLRYCYPPFPHDWTPLSVGVEGGAPLFSIHCLAGSTSEGPYGFGKCRLSPDQQHLQAWYCSSDGREVEVRGGYEVLCVRRGEEERLCWVPARLVSSTAKSSFVFSGYGRFGVARAEQGCGVHPGVMEPSGRCVIPYAGRAVVVTGTAEVLCETARLPASLLAVVQDLDVGAGMSELLRAGSGQAIGSFTELLHKWQPPLLYAPPSSLQPVTRQSAASFDWDGANGSGSGEGAVKTGTSENPSTSSLSPSPTSPLARSGTAGSSVRLLVCHDFCGGYTAAERRAFVLEESADTARADRRTRTETGEPSKRVALVEGAYTVGYWDRTDCFVYFSHQRISVPPREWIHGGHRRGVPVLGTIITEGAGGVADLELLLSDAKRMAAIIEKLVLVCDTYGFDGYLLNIENNLPPTMAKRLIVFCTQLRKQLNRSAAPSCGRLVVWYDAITIDGTLAYQNALTPRNKPFFDVCDGIFTNYFWNPVHMAISKTAAGPRAADVFVGVDVFGRHMYGGGGYNTNVAVKEAVHANLSVALFAPGWAMECEGKGSRDGFQEAESRLWSRMQEKFAYHARVVDFRPSAEEKEKKTADCVAWTAFASGVGYHFSVNGRRITGVRAAGSPSLTSTTSAWCEVSAAHALPPLLLEAPPTTSAQGFHADPALLGGAAAKRTGPFAALRFSVPASSMRGSMYGGRVCAEWRYDKAWFGDRCLSCLIPPMEAAEVLRWYVQAALPAATADPEAAGAADASLHIEVVLDTPEVADVGKAMTTEMHRGLRLGLFTKTRGAFHAVVWEKAEGTTVPVAGLDGVQVRVHSFSGDGGNEDDGAARTDGWRRVCYTLHNTSTETVHLTSISIANGDASRTLRCSVGAIAVFRTPLSVAPQTESTVTASDVEGGKILTVASETGPTVLCAAGPRLWGSSHDTHATKKDCEKVLALKDAERVLADVADRHGVESTLILFATVASSVTADKKVDGEWTSPATTAAESTVSEDGHHMYLGQYSVAYSAKSTHNGALLVPLSLPEGFVVTQVYYYVVRNGY